MQYAFGLDGAHLAELGKPTDPAGRWVVQREYVWLDGQPLVQLEHPGPGGAAEGHAFFFHADAIGLTRALTNANRDIVWRAETRPYGEVVETTSTDPLSGRVVVTNLRFPGQYDERLLGSLGLQGPYYNWNRWYLPGLGRYLEPDPLAVQGGFNTEFGVDWYGYANQNPLKYADPTGEYSEVCWRKIRGWPMDKTDGRHCYLRTGGSSGETTSYYARFFYSPWSKKVGNDLSPQPGDECHPILPPDDDDCTCTSQRTKFDQCLETEMQKCAQCTYNIVTFNCCDCVEHAVQACGGRYGGPWPDNKGWGPGKRHSNKCGG